MEGGYLTAALQRLRGIWNIRGFMMMSLTAQLLLAVTAPLRPKTSNFFVISLVWSAYFLADWTAIFAFGLISNAGCTKSPTHVLVSNDLLALWASFLLIHLGGSDTITAFSLEDNALWLRHLLRLIAQVFAFFYIFARCCGAVVDFITEKIGMVEAITKFRYTSKFDMENGIWKFMFDTLKGRASDANDPDKVREVHAERDELALQDSTNEVKRFVTEFEYHHIVILWHIATEICYHIDTDLDKNNENVRFSKTFSDYMIHFLVKQPDLMSAVAGIFHKRYCVTCSKLKRFEKRAEVETLEEFCSKVVEEYNHGPTDGENSDGDARSTMLIDSCSLARTLLRTERKWELICRVWVELLAYSAGHCRVNSHTRLPNQGGEFLTFVWLSMPHIGIVPHFSLY